MTASLWPRIEMSLMTTFRSLLSVLTRGATRLPGATNAATLRERARFRRSMPGELGICAAARLYGVGR